jgi:hypothetical protein
MKGLLALLLGLLAALPLLGGDTCGGGGENGVWILPRAGQISQGPSSGPRPINEALTSHVVTDLTHNFVMQASSNMAHIVATLSNPNLGSLGVSVCGSQITLGSSLMQAVGQLPNSRCDLLVIDENYCGYLMSLVFDANRRLTVYVY